MSAVILPFPRIFVSRTQELPVPIPSGSERIRVLNEAIAERARKTNATAAEKFRARQEGLKQLHLGKSLGVAIPAAWAEMPSTRDSVVWPLDPRPAA
jgi:hypothetical protein